MPVTIGFITARKSLDYITELNAYFKEYCTLLYLPYKLLDTIPQLYSQNEEKVDGFLFSGELVYRHFLTLQEEITKPCYYLSITPLTLQQFLFKLILENRRIDFKRIFIDFVYNDNLMQLDEIFGEQSMPLHMDGLLNHFRMDVQNSYETQLYLWQQGAIDLSITRLGENVEALSQKGVNCKLITPSPEDVISRIKECVKDIQLKKLQSRKIIIANVSMDSNTVFNTANYGEVEMRFNTLYDMLIQYGNENNLDFVIQRHSLGYEVIFYGYILKTLTDGYKKCALLSFLNERLQFKVVVGWGEGRDIYTVRLCAENAVKISQNKDSKQSFAITEEGDVIGPLGDESLIKYSNIWNPVIDNISVKSGLNIQTIQKIAGILQDSQSSYISSNELADVLRVTIRSSNRILNRLLESGYAELVEGSHAKQKGRPKKIYKLNFGDQ